MTGYRCIRSVCVQNRDVSRRKHKYDEKNINCPVRLAVYKVGNEYVIWLSKGTMLEHNHEPDARFHRRQKQDVAKVMAKIRNGATIKDIYTAQATFRGLVSTDQAAMNEAYSNIVGELALDEEFTIDELRRIERKVRAEAGGSAFPRRMNVLHLNGR